MTEAAQLSIQFEAFHCEEHRDEATSVSCEIVRGFDFSREAWEDVRDIYRAAFGNGSDWAVACEAAKYLGVCRGTAYNHIRPKGDGGTRATFDDVKVALQVWASNPKAPPLPRLNQFMFNMQARGKM